jgi:hypothetical protein
MRPAHVIPVTCVPSAGTLNFRLWLSARAYADHSINGITLSLVRRSDAECPTMRRRLLGPLSLCVCASLYASFHVQGNLSIVWCLLWCHGTAVELHQLRYDSTLRSCVGPFICDSKRTFTRVRTSSSIILTGHLYTLSCFFSSSSSLRLFSKYT